VALMTMIGYFQVFAEPYVMTQGGPANRTLSVVLLMYEEGFRWWNMGYASAAAFVLFALISGGDRVAIEIAAKRRRGQLMTPFRSSAHHASTFARTAEKIGIRAIELKNRA
jgi:hypothetical protein